MVLTRLLPSRAPRIPTVLAALTRVLAPVMVLGAAPAFAQGIASNAEAAREGEELRGDTRVAEIDEIERGFYMGLDYGANYYFPTTGPGNVALNPDGSRVGTRMGIRIGYDILNNIKLDAFLVANFNEGAIDAKQASLGVMTGDIAHFAPGLAVRFDYITTEDQRFFAYVRAGGGVAFWFPTQLALNQQYSIHTNGALGIEYYTRLRHVSASLEADFQALLNPNAFGIAVYPSLKYTF